MKVTYFDLGDIYNLSLGNKEFSKEVQSYYDSNPHNNGWASFFEIFDPINNDLYGYPLMNQYFLSEGAVIGERVLLHSYW